MKAMLDHVAIRTPEYDKTRAFFEDVFSMQCRRETGEKPCRKLWFTEGVQLCETAASSEQSGDNGFDHFCLCVENPAAVVSRIKTSYPECTVLDDQWFLLPDNTKVELKLLP